MKRQLRYLQSIFCKLWATKKFKCISSKSVASFKNTFTISSIWMPSHYEKEKYFMKMNAINMRELWTCTEIENLLYNCKEQLTAIFIKFENNYI